MDSHTINAIEKKRFLTHSDRGTTRTSKSMEPPSNDDSTRITTTTLDERPIKIQRLKQDDVNAFVEEHKSSTLNIYEYDHSCRNSDHKYLYQLQMLIQHFNQNVIPNSYDSDDTSDDVTPNTSKVDEFAHECTALLKVLDATHLNHIDCTMTFHQLHGTLSLWLSYIISLHIPWDVTNIDCFEVRTKLICTTNHICTCLLEIYRITSHINHVPLPSIESFLILFKTILFLTKPIGSSKPLGYHEMALLSALFEAVEYTLHTVDCIRGMTTYEFKQFILCLVQASTTCLDITTSTVSGTNQIAWRMLEQFNHSMDESHALLAKFAQVAISVVPDPQLSLIERSGEEENLSAIHLFRIRCALQMPSKQLDVPIIVESLRLFHKAVSTYPDYPSNDQLIILDCLVIITSSHYAFESENLKKSMYGTITDILVHFLSAPEINSTTFILTNRAIESLQNLFEEGLSPYIMDSTRYDSSTMQKVVTCIFNLCTHQYHRNYQGFGNYSNNDGESGLNDLWNFPLEDFVLGSAEVLLAILSYILDEYSNSVVWLPVPLMMNMCTKLLNHLTSSTNPKSILSLYPKRNQHIQYLIIHMISENVESLGLYMQTYPGLIGAMADVLKIDFYDGNDNTDPQVAMTIQRTILNVYQHLLQSNQSIFQSILGRDSNVIAAIVSVVVNDTTWFISATTTELESMVNNQEIAIELLCTLSDDVLNRSVMVRHTHLLSGMIRYLRCMDVDDTAAKKIQHDRLKQCVTQLSAAL